MAAIFPSSIISTTPSSSSLMSPTSMLLRSENGRRHPTPYRRRAASADEPPPHDSHSARLSRRGLSTCLVSGFLYSLDSVSLSNSNAAILEADDDDELMEKVKRDRKKRLDRQEAIRSSDKEKAYVQELIYKLDKVGQAIDNSDLSAAGSVLGGTTDADWVRKANSAFTKLSFSPEEKMKVNLFNSSLDSLISSVVGNDVDSSKTAFVSSAKALEEWIALTGLVGQLKGL